MGEIRIVNPGKTCGYPYPVCKKPRSDSIINRVTIQYAQWSENLQGVLKVTEVLHLCSEEQVAELGEG